MALDASLIDYWAMRYPVEFDQEVLDVVGSTVRERGHYDREDLMTVGR